MDKTDILIKFDEVKDMSNIYNVVSPWGQTVMSIPALANYVLIRLAGQLSKDNQDPKSEYVYQISVTDLAEEDMYWVRVGRLDSNYYYHSENGYKLHGLDADRFILFLSQDMEFGLRRAIGWASKGVIQITKLQV